ncbi:thiamine ABC transporter substrate-binding protein [Haloprofundus salilacus]|uniref:thiamine ABC transporter substrate-binding protein n=1 Tax=Haloprofundus salilacus TaxID=2876190 RepID=UPI001CCD44FD|nr:thiamine ABC transporter substrate-binding protein [Haloprofundus salilacus]
MNRRSFLKAAGASGVAAFVAGCSAEPVDDGADGPTANETGGQNGTEGETGTATGTPSGPETLRVATYSSFVDAPSSSPGQWIKERFESEFDATLEWQIPDNEINYFIERAAQGVDSDADAYVGLDTNMLIRVDENVDGQLFAPVESDAVEGRNAVQSGLEFDPQGRAIPYDTGYISLVYNENDATAPQTFDGLLRPEFEGDLLAQDPQSSATGQAFLLHTIKAKGEDGYLDYWEQLQQNGVRVLGTWEDSYAAYSNGESPMVVSYSTDQVYANEEGEDLSEHQIRFLNGEAYANPEGMARFADSQNTELANRFLSFMLRPKVQAEIAVRNVQFPAIADAPLPEEFAQYAKEPETPVTFTYEELKGNLSEWTDAWARQFASN